MTTLKIDGMTCGHCVKSVEKALAGVPGVETVRAVDLDSGEAQVEGSASPESLIAAIEAEGYKAQVQ